jgi:mannose-1-phosphate guanylyltransferase
MYASILAGGSGTRLWPLSTKQSPKQFLRLPGPRTMLEETVERIAPLTPLDQLYVVTFANYKDAVAEQIPDLPREQIVAEPVGRGTAASIGLAATLIAARDPQAVMGSFHADHVITDIAGFRQALTFAEQLAREGRLITLGVTPTAPETGYGYIQYGALVGASGALTAYRGASFKEKPAREIAEQYLQAGNYVWNSGIFVWRVDRILEEIRRYVPMVAGVLDEIGAAARASGGRMTPEVERVMAAVWPRLQETVTIDEGVLEKASDLVVIPVSVGWSDIGGWAQILELHSPDANGNAVVGLDEDGHIEIEAQGNLIYSSTGRTIAIAGAHNLIVVDTPEGLLICSKERTQSVREIASFAQRREERT